LGTTGGYYLQKQIDEYYWQKQYDITYREKEIDKRLSLIDDFTKITERYIECEYHSDGTRLPTPIQEKDSKYSDCSFDGFISVKAQINQVRTYFGKKIEPDIGAFENKYYEEISIGYKTQSDIDTKINELIIARDKVVKTMQKLYNNPSSL